MTATEDKMHALRLLPGQDLKTSLQAYATSQHLHAGWMVTCVGSLREVHLRMAGESAGTRLDGPFEIVSLVGTLGTVGCHLHLCASDRTGHVVGGHLLTGNPVYTTAEVVLGEAREMIFARELDPATGYAELVIRKP